MKTVTAELLPNGNLHVSVPLSVKQTGGVTRIIVPGEEAADPGRQAFLLAVARGRRWQQLIDEGKVENIKALAALIGRDFSPHFSPDLAKKSLFFRFFLFARLYVI